MTLPTHDANTDGSLDQNAQSTQQTTPANQTETQQAQTGDDKRFTQDELDRIISDRLKRDRESTKNQLFESLGVQNADELKSILEETRKRKESEMSELEKAQAEIDKYKAQAEAAKAQAEQIAAQRLADARKSAFIEAIRHSGGSDESELYILVNASMQDELNAVFDDGQAKPDETKLKGLVQAVQGKYPKYFGNPGAGSPSNSGGVNPQSKQAALEDAQKEIDKLF